MLENVQPIFILGSPRSGTTMLQVLLSSHPKVASTVQLSLFDRYIGPWIDTWEMEAADIRDKEWPLGLPVLWKREQFDAVIAEFLRRVYTDMLERAPGATHILDKNPGYSMHVETIKRFFPRARFLHMIRDGRDVACSLMAAKKSMGFGTDEAAAAGVVWRNLVLGARRAAQFGDDYLEVRYEDYLADPQKSYRAALEFCRLPYDEKWLTDTIEANSFEKMKERQATGDPGVKTSKHHYRTGKSGNWKADFTPQMRFEFDLAAGKVLRELGYAGDFWWAESDAERAWLPRKHYWRRRRQALGYAWEWLKAAALGRSHKSVAKRIRP